MNAIYENEVNGMEDMAEALKNERLFILFGDNAPDTLIDFCPLFIKHDKKKTSLMNIGQLLALGVKLGDEIVVIADGEDETGAIEAAISVIQYTK